MTTHPYQQTKSDEGEILSKPNFLSVTIKQWCESLPVITLPYCCLHLNAVHTSHRHKVSHSILTVNRIFCWKTNARLMCAKGSFFWSLVGGLIKKIHDYYYYYCYCNDVSTFVRHKWILFWRLVEHKTGHKCMHPDVAKVLYVISFSLGNHKEWAIVGYTIIPNE